MNSNPDRPGLLSNVKGDFLGGITAGIVALPLALAFGLSSGLGPDAGLYGAIFLAFFAALFGGTNTQISGPTAPMTAVSMLVIAGIVQANEGNVQQALPSILAVFMLAGFMLVLLGLTGVGQYIKYMPYPVVSGFMTAIGVIIIITQVLPLVGYYPKEDLELVNQFIPQAEEVLLEKILLDEAGEGILVLEDFKETIARAASITQDQITLEAEVLTSKHSSGVLGAIRVFPRAVNAINFVELILAFCTIILIYGFKRITTVIPSTLIALVVVSVAAVILQSQGIIGYRPIPVIPGNIPMPNMEIFTEFSIGMITPYIFTAFTLALLGAIDSLLTSVVADNMTRTQHDPNRELIGQGIGNSIAALFGGIPGAGATIRTVVNINAGGKTRLSGMIAGVFLIVILLALGPIASRIPAAVLAGILITVGIGVMDYRGLRALPNTPRSEVLILILVLVLAVVWNLVYAVLIGLVISALGFMKKMGDHTNDKSQVLNLADASKNEEYWDDELNFPPRLEEEVYIKHLSGPLFFGYTRDFQTLAQEIPDTATHVIVRMEKVPFVDQSGLYALEDVFTDLVKKDIEIHLVGLQIQPEARMRSIDIVPDLVPEAFLFPDFSSCLKYVIENVEDVV
ncbi:MAG: SulP family sulfate permease [Limisphaerales bacterium]|jgi:SulP family sulfate permease